jgi:chromate transporter
MTPGPIAINAATFVGYRLAGVAGSVAATAAVVGAPILVLAGILWLFSRPGKDKDCRGSRSDRIAPGRRRSASRGAVDARPSAAGDPGL